MAPSPGIFARGPKPTGAALDALIFDVTQGLCAAGAIASPQDILFADLKELRYAYVVFDDHYFDATRTIFSWLKDHQVLACGRYGSWTYNSMEDCLIAGREAAQTVDQALRAQQVQGE